MSNEEGLALLKEGKIKEFNYWRMKNLTLKLDISNEDFSNRNLSGAFLNGTKAENVNFSRSVLESINFVQGILNNCNFDGADLSNGIFMYAEMKNCSFSLTNLTNTNLMFAELQNSYFSNAKLCQTIFVEAHMENIKAKDIDKQQAYLKFAKMDGANW